MSMKLMQKAIDNFDEVEPILMKIDFEPARKFWDKWATKEHIRLLRKNKSLFNRVPTIKQLTDEKMRSQSLIFAMGIAKILSDIKEGETHRYVNLKIRKINDKIIVEKKGSGEA